MSLGIKQWPCATVWAAGMPYYANCVIIMIILCAFNYAIKFPKECIIRLLLQSFLVLQLVSFETDVLIASSW